jgi:hypothetical protein
MKLGFQLLHHNTTNPHFIQINKLINNIFCVQKFPFVNTARSHAYNGPILGSFVEVTWGFFFSSSEEISVWTVQMETKISEVHIYDTYLWKVKLRFYSFASYMNKIRDSIQGHEPPHSHIHAEAVTCEELLRWKFCESANLHMRARACCLWTWLLWLAICCNKRQVSPFWFFAPQCGKQTDTTILHLEAPSGPPATSIPPGNRTYNNISTH